MPRPINVKKIIKKNRKINASQLGESLILTEKLRKLGVHRRGYRLASPFTRKQVGGNESELDPRTVQLRHS
jgi:hypothetical protein